MSRLSPINVPNPHDTPPDDDPYHFSFRNDDETPNFTSKSPSHQQNPYTFNQTLGAPGSDSNRETQQRNGVWHRYQKEQPRKKGSTSVVIHIKLSATLIKEIRCNLEDNVLELANNFCKENNLSLDAVPIIINMIKQQFSVMLQRMRENIKPMDNSGSSDEKVNSKVHNNSQPNINNSQRQDTLKRTTGINSNNTPSIPNTKLVGKLEVTIGNGQQGLYLFEGEDPVKVAYQFCKEHSLPLDLVEVLAIKLEKMRRWQEQKKQQEQQDQQQIEHRNPFKAGANLDKQSTGSTSFYQHGTAAFVTEESDVGEALENTESKKDHQGVPKHKFIVDPTDDSPTQQASRNKELQLTDRARPKQVQPSFKEPDYEDEEITQPVKQQTRKASKSPGPLISNKHTMVFTNQNSQVNKPAKASLVDSGLDISPREGDKKLTKNQAQNLMQRLYYDGKAKESIVQAVRGTGRQSPRHEDSMTQGSDLNRSRSQKKSPPKVVVVKNVSENRSPKNSNMVTTKGNFAFQPKISEPVHTANSRIVDPKSRSKSPIYEKFSIENLVQKHKESQKQAAPIPRKLSPDRRDVPSPAQTYLQSKAMYKEEEKKTARVPGVDEKPKDNKPKPKYFQQSINKAGAGVIVRKNSQKDVKDNAQGNSFVWKGDYRELFDQLDSDRDGFISAQNINLGQLPPRLADAFVDLVDMLQDTDLILDFKGFLTALDQLGIEEKILKMLERENPRQTSSKVQVMNVPPLFGRKGSPKGLREQADEMLHPEFGDEPNLAIGKALSKRSEISTASSNQTENSSRSTKFYPDLLDRKV